MDLSKATPDQLRAELERREKPKLPAPVPLEKPDWTPLLNTCKFGIDDAIERGYIDKNLKEYIFEAAIEACYGPTIWAWWNEQDQPG